jgi:O-antigen/teichoic acid export membrane protein
MSIKKNFLYNGLLSISNYVFPFLTFPYISRVLGVENLGKCNFVDGVINYFLLFASLGIGAIGIREIAKNKGNRTKLEVVYSSLLTFNFITTLVVSIIYIVAILYITKLDSYKELLYIGLGKIISTMFLIEWFYAGIENFRFIAIRSILIKLGYIFFVFLLIKNPEDYQIYFLLTISITVLNALVNLYYSRKFVKINFNGLSLKPLCQPIFVMGFHSLLTYMYTSFNIIYLGFIAGDKEVGYYTTAIKIYTILLSIFTAFTTVMLPRMSHLVLNKEMNEIKSLINKSYDALFILSIPLLSICTMLAPQIVYIIAGPGFEGAIIPMQIVMPLILIIGIAQILIIQILMPFNNDRHIFVNSFIGAIVGLVLNLVLISRLSSIGSAIALVFSEFAVVVSANYFVKKETSFVIPYRKIINNFFYAIPYFFLSWLAVKIFKSSIVITLFAFSASAIYFVLIQKYFIKNDLYIQLENTSKMVLLKILRR